MLIDFRLIIISVWERNLELHHEDVAPNTSDYAIWWIFLHLAAREQQGQPAPKGRVAGS